MNDGEKGLDEKAVENSDQEQAVCDESTDIRKSADLEESQVLKEKIAELEDSKLRMVAEMQNTRKRLVKQQQEDHKYRHQDILKDLAEVIDNFERAIESSVKSREFDTFHAGIEMIGKQFIGMLTDKYHLQRIAEPGGGFDPLAHEAMMMEESEEVDNAMVKQVLQAGYRLYDRVLRPAKVIVVKPIQSSNETRVVPEEIIEEGVE